MKSLMFGFNLQSIVGKQARKRKRKEIDESQGHK